MPYNVSHKLTGAFAPGIDSACAPVTATAITSSATNADYAALTDEVSGASGTLCIADPNAIDQSPNQISLTLIRTVRPTTSVFLSAFSATSTEQWEMTWSWIQPDPPVRRADDHVPGFGQAAPLNPSALYTYVGNSPWTAWYGITSGGQTGSSSTITFMP